MNKLSLLFLCIALIIAACKTKKQSRLSPSDISTLNVKEDTASIDISELHHQIQSNHLKYKWLNIKAKAIIPVSLNKENEVNINIRIKKDSLIWISANALFGIEIGRILISPDTIKILDRINKKLFIKNLDYIKSVAALELDYHDIEAILTASPVFYEVDTSAKSTVVLLKGKDEFNIKGIHKNYHTNTYIEKSKYKIKKILIQDKIIMQNLLAIYDDYQNIENDQLFPFKMKFKVFVNLLLQVELILKINKVRIDEPTNFPFNVPDKYEKVF